MSESKIVDFNSDNSLFHPFVQKIRNYRSKDYLIKLLKRNLEQKLRKNRRQYDEKPEPEKTKCKCHCKCTEKTFRKRCGHCQHPRPQQHPPYKPFVCESEGSFADPSSCRQFYICFHKEQDPIEVTCPRGFAFDSAEGKCTRRAERECAKKQTATYKN
ncbi:hypothetical protein Zmor_009557 [Zophobas morio]|uniref:Chitin-binding type-2 domain-containing protein n=1 Tax=Zophobas morio TaxID=2755281 RepID=A0AA38ILB2_9CUCU|nr:hypothetical protein Zmor_009557 [Zophobas morio]